MPWRQVSAAETGLCGPTLRRRRSLARAGRQAFPAFLPGERPLFVLAVGGVSGGVGAALVVLQGQVAVRVAVAVWTRREEMREEVSWDAMRRPKN